VLAALKSEILAKAEIKGNLDTYKYYDNVSNRFLLLIPYLSAAFVTCMTSAAPWKREQRRHDVSHFAVITVSLPIAHDATSACAGQPASSVQEHESVQSPSKRA
jgi:hypothetical protein